MRHNKKRDLNDKAIYDALKAAHCRPLRGNDCDIYCISRTDQKGMLIEVKNGKGQMRKIQVELRELFQDRYAVCRSVAEALRACGVGV